MNEPGKNFELNMSFVNLQDRHWRHVLNTLWGQETVGGPYATEYRADVTRLRTVDIQYPDPTATFTQYGKLVFNNWQLPIKVLVTRSLFECISITIANNTLNQPDVVDQLQHHLKRIAVKTYQASRFQIASLGWDRECQLPNELLNDEKARAAFVEVGGFLAQDSILAQLELPPDNYEEILSGLRWVPPLTTP